MAKPNKTAAKKEKQAKAASNAKVMQFLPLSRGNYLRILIGVALLILGYILLGMEDFIDATEFSIALYISPWVIVSGYVVVIWALLYRDPKADGAAQSSQESAQ